MSGTVTITHEKLSKIRVIRCACVGDASDGTIPQTTLPVIGGRLLAIETNPGSVAPSSNWDVAVTDQNGIDVLQNVGVNRHTTNSEKAAVVFSGTSIHPYVARGDVLTLAVSGNAVASALMQVDLYYEAV